MEVKIKKLHPDSVIPKYAKPGDAGMDLTAVSRRLDKNGNIVYGTGLAFEIPEGYVGLVFPRSSNSKTNMYLTNSVGVIDSGYRGEVTFKYKAIYYAINYFKYWWQMFWGQKLNVDIHNLNMNHYEVGDRIGQIIIMPYPMIEFVEVEELSETERGINGYGSTGK